MQEVARWLEEKDDGWYVCSSWHRSPDDIDDCGDAYREYGPVSYEEALEAVKDFQRHRLFQLRNRGYVENW